MKKKEDQGQCSSQTIHNIQSYQEQLLLQQMMQQQQNGDVLRCNNNARGLTFPEVSVSPILQLPPPWSLPPVHSFNPSEPGPTREPDPFFVSSPLSPYASLFNRRVPSLQFAYECPSSDRHHLRIISEPLGVEPAAQPGSAPFGLQTELGKMTAQEIMDAKALAASKSHSEAERRRRERINNHLAKLRSLLPSNTKTDKASLLAEVIQHVKELKRQTSVIAETSAVPTESDELSVDDASEEGRLVMRASLCCDDRSDLLTDLIEALKTLRLRTLKAEIATLGGRVRNVLFVTAEEDHQRHRRQQQHCVSSVQEALRAVIDKNTATTGDDNAIANAPAKRQRTTHTHSNTTINVLPRSPSFS